MTIKYLDSKRLSGSETTSTVTASDDFSSDNFTDDNGVGVNTTNKTLGGAFPRGARTATYKAITELSDTSWVIRFKFNLTSIVSNPEGCYIGVTDVPTGTSNTTRDAIMFWVEKDGGSYYTIAHPSDTLLGLSYTRMSTTPADGDVYYVELKRTSATAGTCSLYNDSEFSDLEEAKNFTTTANNSGLDNFLMLNLIGGTGGTVTCTIEDLKIYDEVTSVVSRDTKPTNVQDNSIYIETDTDKRFWFDGSSWGSETEAIRGIFAGGVTGSGTKVNTMDYITIASTGNATDFGDLTSNIKVPTGLSSLTRGVWGGGQTSGYVDTIDYVTIATTGNATDFGNLTSARGYVCGASNATRGIFYSGYFSSAVNNIDYITIATVGNATDFGDSGTARESTGGVSSDTRAVFAGGYVLGAQNVIDYITIATTGNTTDFGDLTSSRYASHGVDNGTRGCFAGGWISTGQDTIDYITIATTGNATDFGDLTQGRAYSGSVSNDTKGVWGGGNITNAYVNTIDYITIDTLGNATDFGDLTTSKGHMSQGASGK